MSENKLGKVSPVWVKNKDVTMCMLCANDFSTFLRRHHCRACGAVSLIVLTNITYVMQIVITFNALLINCLVIKLNPLPHLKPI